MRQFSELTDRIRRLAADDPDRVAYYWYFDETPAGVLSPMCIWGHVIADLARPTGMCRVQTPTGELVLRSIVEMSPDDWRSLGVEPPDPDQRIWSAMVQVTQDDGHPWRDAVLLSDETLREISG